MNKKQLTRLSRTMSYALRHKPEEFDLRLDEQGWVDLKDLAVALRSHHSEWESLVVEDLHAASQTGSKRRFEFSGAKIRALYGHSVDGKIDMESEDPPEILFHGTTPDALPDIRTAGLKPMARQYVHLSPNEATATTVASRRTRTPVILTIKAREAARQGVKFYRRGEGIWLADDIGPVFVVVPERGI